MRTNFAKTKIICTIGPASNNAETIRNLINSGMNICRLNFSHGDIESHRKTIDLIRKVEKETNANISILQDLPGPKIRIGNLDREEYELKAGSTVFLTKDEIVGNDKTFSCSYKEVIESLQCGEMVFLNDGRIELVVTEKKSDGLVLKVLNSGTIRSHKGLNIPSKNLNISAITDLDIEYVKFGIEMDVDFVAASFIRCKEDVLKLKKIIDESGKNIKIISKIENPTALDNIDSILEVSHGIMIARGDLGIEVPIEEVALKQKFLINKARALSKPTIVATQMLISMINEPIPTRAEVSDITNAVIDGADALMLSEETAIGKYAVDACSTMNQICLLVENQKLTLDPSKNIQKHAKMYPELALSYAAEEIAENLDISAFVVLTRTGKTAQLISSRRMNKPILTFTTDHKVVEHLNLCWGVTPYYLEEIKNRKVLTETVLKFIKDNKLLPEGSLVLITCGTTNSKNISTNLLELQSI